MHWRAIRQSNRSYDSNDFRAYDGAQSNKALQTDYRNVRELLYSQSAELPNEPQHEEASTTISGVQLLLNSRAVEARRSMLISQVENGAIDTHFASHLSHCGTATEIDQPDPNNDRFGNRKPSSAIDEEKLYLQETGSPIPRGQDEAFDANPEPQQLPVGHAAESHEPNPRSEEDTLSINSEDDLSSHPIPAFSTGLTTFAYERALRNRIRDISIGRGGKYDRRRFPPTFVHDCLMLPGSLANVIGKASPEPIIRKITPALLPGFRAYVHSETQQPCLLPSAKDDDYAQGMLIFGQGKAARDLIHTHYRPYARRVKVQVEINVQIPILGFDGAISYEVCSLQRRNIWAHAWLWSNAANLERGEGEFRRNCPGWTLEDYLSGNLDDYQRPMKIGLNGFIGRDYDADASEEDESEEGERCLDERQGRIEREQFDVVYRGYGTLVYERDDAAVGWW